MGYGKPRSSYSSIFGFRLAGLFEYLASWFSVWPNMGTIINIHIRPTEDGHMIDTTVVQDGHLV